MSSGVINQIAVTELYLSAVNEQEIFTGGKLIRAGAQSGDYTEQWINRSFRNLAKRAVYIYKRQYCTPGWQVPQQDVNALADRLKDYYLNVYQD